VAESKYRQINRPWAGAEREIQSCTSKHTYPGVQIPGMLLETDDGINARLPVQSLLGSELEPVPASGDAIFRWPVLLDASARDYHDLVSGTRSRAIP
jgi:hypothetical protein